MSIAQDWSSTAKNESGTSMHLQVFDEVHRILAQVPKVDDAAPALQQQQLIEALRDIALSGNDSRVSLLQRTSVVIQQTPFSVI